MTAPVYLKDPDETLKITVDWSDRIGADTIASKSFTADAGLTNAGEGADGATTTVSLTGGTAGVDYKVLAQIASQTGQETLQRTLIVRVRDNP